MKRPILLWLCLLNVYLCEAQNTQLNTAYYQSGFECQTFPVLAGNKLFYPSNLASLGQELVSANLDLTAASLTKDIYPVNGWGAPRSIASVGNKVIFTADDGIYGRELYTSDGTASGTIRLTDVLTGADGGFGDNALSLSFGSYALISQYDGKKIYATDGTPTGTKLAISCNNGSNSSSYFFSVGGKSLLFNSNDGAPDSLYLYDYPTNGKSFLGKPPVSVSYYIYPGDRPANTISFGNQFVIGFGTFFFVSNGTPQGTYTVSQSGGQSFENATEFTFLDGKVYYVATTGFFNREIHSLDLQTHISNRAEINLQGNSANGSYPFGLTVFSDTLFFMADDGFYGHEPYKMKGSYFTRIADLAPGSDGGASSVDSINGMLIINRYPIPYAYRNGAIQPYPHQLYSWNEVSNRRKATSCLTVPGVNAKFAIFTSSTGSDTLARLSSNGSFDFFPSSESFTATDFFRQTLLAGNRAYFASEYINYLWYIDLSQTTGSQPLTTEYASGTFYPNPVSGRTVHYQGTEALQNVRLIDATGRVHCQIENLRPQEELPLKDVPSGLYFIQATESDRPFCQRLIVQ